eukprot:4482123-Amphidinium_carterae.1
MGYAPPERSAKDVAKDQGPRSNMLLLFLTPLQVFNALNPRKQPNSDKSKTYSRTLKLTQNRHKHHKTQDSLTRASEKVACEHCALLRPINNEYNHM